MSAAPGPRAETSIVTDAEELAVRILAAKGSLEIRRDLAGWHLQAGDTGSLHNGSLEDALRCLFRAIEEG